MSEKLATYTFLPWLRKGLSNQIVNDEGDPNVNLRASVPIDLLISATAIDGSKQEIKIDNTVQLYGPGDIIGINKNAIVRAEPQNRIANFEPNYLPYLEFYEEDFPWRYTPYKTEGDRLKPWITLVVLKEEEFEEGTQIKPLPFFRLKSINTEKIFPNPSELWAWAHVHVNDDLSKGKELNAIDPEAVNKELTRLNRDLVYSRIICPRKLEPNISYHAFLIPTFESGRLAGLGEDFPAFLKATKCAWEEDNADFPYYYRWSFKTGNAGDFEYLVDLLKPKLADKSIGNRDMDVSNPGSQLPPITDEHLKGVLKLGGALRVPFDSLNENDKLEVRKYDEWDEHPYPHPLVSKLAERINLTDEVISQRDNANPVVTLPLYGQWHALQQRLLKDRDGVDMPDHKNWVHELNLDPRFRVSAGLGTKVVQKHQEEYMQASWQQVGDIMAANNKIRLAQMAKAASERLYSNHLLPLQPEKLVVFSSAVQKRIVYNGFTVHHQLEASLLPPVLMSGAFRSLTRKRGPLMRKLKFDNIIHEGNLLERINNEDVKLSPPKVDPVGSVNINDVKEKHTTAPSFIKDLLNRYKWFKFLPLFVLIVLLMLVGIFFPSTIGSKVWSIIAIILLLIYYLFNRWDKEKTNANPIAQADQRPEAIEEYIRSPDFKVSGIGSTANATTGNSDSEEAKLFKEALADVFVLVNTEFKEKEKAKVNIGEIANSILVALNPARTIPLRTYNSIDIPKRILDNMVNEFEPVRVYPEIDIPMYKPLVDISSELFLPNIDRIEQNSITILENNQKFIEAYMVGVNHEMSRELLWREYPTDMRGTYFRQFWDVSSFLSSETDEENAKENLRDIPPIHLWQKNASPSALEKNELGQHNQRALKSGKTQIVLVIRGELLKRYPSAVIYAHKAAWGELGGVKSVDAKRELAALNDEASNDSLTKIKMPLFEAKVEPDIYFLGFDLDDEEARGTKDPKLLSDDPGWFFVIKERPGEPRFGLDIEKAETSVGVDRIADWNSFSWEDISTRDGNCIQLNDTISLLDGSNQEDKKAKWNKNDTDAAQIAYILYQSPVLVGVHASRMLPK